MLGRGASLAISLGIDERGNQKVLRPLVSQTTEKRYEGLLTGKDSKQGLTRVHSAVYAIKCRAVTVRSSDSFSATLIIVQDVDKSELLALIEYRTVLTPVVAEQELPFTEIPEDPVFDATLHPTLVCSETYRQLRKTRVSMTNY